MDVLYKYMSATAAEELLSHGRIRVGTLYEYRDTVEHSREVADRLEGRRQIVVDVAGADAVEQVDRAVRDHGLARETDVRVVENDRRHVVVEAHSRNLFLFSASHRCDHELMSSLEHDTCVAIHRPDAFFRALTASLPGIQRFLGFRDVIYEDPHRPERTDAGLHPAFFKGIEYSHQAEVRALWEPLACDIEPVVVECRDVAGFCELRLSVSRMSSPAP